MKKTTTKKEKTCCKERKVLEQKLEDAIERIAKLEKIIAKMDKSPSADPPYYFDPHALVRYGIPF